MADFNAVKTAISKQFAQMANGELFRAASLWGVLALQLRGIQSEP